MPLTVIPVFIFLAIFALLLGIVLIQSIHFARQDRRRIVAQGVRTQGRITEIRPPSRTRGPRVRFSYPAASGTREVVVQQTTTNAAIQRLRLSVGSSVQVQFLPKWPKSGFIPALTYAERVQSSEAAGAAPREGEPTQPALFYVTYKIRTAQLAWKRSTSNEFGWVGGGDVLITNSIIQLSGIRQALFRGRRPDQRRFALTSVQDVEQHGAEVRFSIQEPGGNVRPLQLITVNPDEARALAQLLPDTKTEHFVPVLKERAEFDSALPKLTPKAFVTPALIGANILMFLIEIMLGGGVMIPNSDALIKLGTDFTPYTLDGQWWRLLSSTFIHFGLMHLAVNMWALYMFGGIAERIFGNVRFLAIYLLTGVAASVASLLWHPVVNGAGASGAIFGVLGALLAFFLKKEGGTPASVVRSLRNSTLIFVAYSLLNGARHFGIDNSAHVGGLCAGLVLGYILSRPLALDRDQRPWAQQWINAAAVCAGAGAVIFYLLATGALGPGYAHLPGRPLDPMGGTAKEVTSQGNPGRVTPMPKSIPQAGDPLTAMVAQQYAALDVKAKSATLPSDLGLEVLMAIRHGDHATASRIALDVLAHSHLRRWGFYPFSAFMDSITRDGNDPVLLDQLNVWLTQEPKSSIAYLIRAEYFERAAWVARGEDVLNKVSSQEIREFDADLTRAAADTTTAMTLDPGNPWSHYLLMNIFFGAGNTSQIQQIFQDGVKTYPNYYELYRTRLNSLTPKWGGSVQAMYAFVNQYAARAPDNSPLNLLYLQLYAYLLDATSFDCGSLKGDDWQRCFDAEAHRFITPELETGVTRGLNLYKVTDPAEFSAALWPVLNEMTKSAGRSASGVDTLLQKAATIMGTDNRIGDEPGHNSYVIDDVTARLWARIGNPTNAEKKYLEALSDAENTSFTDEVQKDTVLASIFDDLTKFANDNSQYINMIVYADASNAVGGINHGDTPYMKCYAYYMLKHFTDAVSECTRVIDNNGNYLQSHYWRARAYEGLEKWDSAMADLGPIADSSDNWFRVGAAIELSVVYGKKNDAAGQLASMQSHPYLFDPDLQPPDDLAVAYNNRCYAYMQLGLLKQALDDCNMSLKYGRIPDAVRKQQLLLKQLTTKAGT
jgi:membrane associated rhomboid family serine protease/tetratricopeptide (TPR) repeat protein